MKGLLEDFERSMTDRIYSNLKLGFEHLPKRILARSKTNLFSYPVYVSPGISAEYEIRESLPPGVSCEFVRAEGDVYGAPSSKLATASTSAAGVSFGASGLEGTELTVDRNAAKHAHQGGSDCSGCGHHGDQDYLDKLTVPASPFDAGIREKLFIGIVLAVVLVYIFLRFLS